MLIGEIEQRKNIRIRNFEDFDPYMIAIDVYYDSEDFIFTGWLYNLNSSQFNKANRSQNGKGTDFKQDINGYIGNNCFIPTSGNCFLKSINFLTGKDYTEDF